MVTHNKKLLVLFCLYFCGGEALPISDSVPDQIHQFLKKTFFNPIRAKVHEGIQGLADVLAPPSENSSSNDPVSISTTEFNILSIVDAFLPDDEVSSSHASSSSSVSPISAVESEIIEEQVISTTTASTSDTGDKGQNAVPSIDIRLKSLGNETIEVVKELKRLCPELAVRDDENVEKEYRYHPASEKCFKVNRRGPCGVGMTFYKEGPGSVNGTCDCKSTERISIYHESTDTCYDIFTQGYCGENEWLDLTREGQPVCVPNPCSKTPGKDIVYVKGACVKLNDVNKEICTGDLEQVIFVANKRTPECSALPPKSIAVGSVPCNPGNSLAIHGKCHVSKWDFGDDGTEDEKHSQN